MSLALSGFSASHSSAAASLIQTTYAILEPAQQAGSRSDGTTVTLSSAGRQLAANDATLSTAVTTNPVTAAVPVEKISAAASERLGNFFRSVGIDVGANVQFDVDALGKLQISGVDGLTAAKIKAQLDDHPDVAAAIHTLSSLSA